MIVRKVATYRRSGVVLQSSGCRQIGPVLGGAFVVSIFLLWAAHSQGMPPLHMLIRHLPLASCESHRTSVQDHDFANQPGR
jgi:hypothetical protein